MHNEELNILMEQYSELERKYEKLLKNYEQLQKEVVLEKDVIVDKFIQKGYLDIPNGEKQFDYRNLQGIERKIIDLNAYEKTITDYDESRIKITYKIFLKKQGADG